MELITCFLYVCVYGGSAHRIMDNLLRYLFNFIKLSILVFHAAAPQISPFFFLLCCQFRYCYLLFVQQSFSAVYYFFCSIGNARITTFLLHFLCRIDLFNFILTVYTPKLAKQIRKQTDSQNVTVVFFSFILHQLSIATIRCTKWTNKKNRIKINVNAERRKWKQMEWQTVNV